MKPLLIALSLITFCHAVEPRMSFLQNEQVKVGVDLSLGGAITWLSPNGGENRVNNFDYGRQIQLSYFSGPVPFEANGQKPAEHWKHIGWNPIQAGDDFHHGSQTVEHRNDGRELYVKCIPLQWPLNNVPGECMLESWLQLDGPVVKVRARLVNSRPDKTQYAARLQELPALYANAAFHRVVSYTGSRPFTNEAPQVMPKSATKHPWSYPQMVSPPRLWQAEDAPLLIIEAAFQTGEQSATLYWRKLEAHLTSPSQSDGHAMW
jgi:hypothetical protein